MYPNASRVLIVDDDRDISLMLSALMKKEGLTSLTAHDGETALQRVPVDKPDMMLVDVRMPGIDGLTVLKRVKETDPHLPVVLITAYAEISASVAAMRAGAFDYLAKPFDHPEVVRVVRARPLRNNWRPPLTRSTRAWGAWNLPWPWPAPEFLGDVGETLVRGAGAASYQPKVQRPQPIVASDSRSEPASAIEPRG